MWACNDGGGGGPPEKSNCFMPLWMDFLLWSHHTIRVSRSSSVPPSPLPTHQPVFFLKAANISHESSEPIHLSKPVLRWLCARVSGEREPKGYATQPIQPPCVCSVASQAFRIFFLLLLLFRLTFPRWLKEKKKKKKNSLKRYAVSDSFLCLNAS